MTRVRATIRAVGGRVSALAPWCLLVFALVVVHLALMTGEHHSDTAAAPHAGLPSISAAPAILSLSAMPDHGDHDGPRSTLDGCPVGQAVLPLILLLILGVIGAYCTYPALSTPGVSGAVRRAPPAAPPPLPAAQRRALLQTFII